MTLKLALTGSIGMGKSTVAQMFVDAGVPLFDADAEVRRLQSGGPLVEKIGARWPDAIVNGAVDRDRLGARVLADRDELAALEVMVHPAVQGAREDFLVAHRGAPALLFDIPLLFETGGDKAFDKVIVVSAPAAVQRERVLARPGMTVAKYDGIIARQMEDAEKRRRADFVIDTSRSLAETRAEVNAILACLGLPTGR
ncbi:dephospho-CoA kinase [Sphingomonas sp.]|uniref:dephospho-CoA kinase n=1 Tax=Sphingomonas sp. TaxID=28214 RepID=UPI00286B797D|nr:dephospho-CoA kinase [Sphingomonas sp.]